MKSFIQSKCLIEVLIKGSDASQTMGSQILLWDQKALDSTDKAWLDFVGKKGGGREKNKKMIPGY